MCDEESETKKSSCLDLSYQAVPDADRDMAAQAYQEFELGRFEHCTSLLKKLLSHRPQDSKVIHNLAVAEYFLHNCKKMDIFNKKMNEVCKLAHIDIQDLESLDDVDSCVALYNKAVIMFHHHQFHAAIGILDKVFQYVEPLEENLARNVCFLLLELYLCVYQPRKALCLISYLETMLFSNSKNCSKANSKEKDSQKEENGDNGVNEIYKRRLQLCKARCYAMIKTSKACKREIKNLMSSGTQAQNIPAFYLKSQLEYQRGNYRKAMKLLNSVTLPADISQYIKETGDFLPTIYYNNMGSIHFYMGKPNLGCHYINKAMESFESEILSLTDNKDTKHNSRPLHLLSTSTQHQLMYNLGMQRLQAQKYLQAFQCFKQVIPSYHSNPRLWLRIAECCINLHSPDNITQFVDLKNISFVKSVIGNGPHRKLILNPSEKSIDVAKPNNALNSETPSLHFALLCLKNALYLVGETQTSTNASESVSSVQTSEDADSSDDSSILPTLPSNFVQGAEILSLRNSILVAASYVSLCLGNVLLAHEYAKLLLGQPKISGAHKFLAHLYAGESLLLMDRITDAVEHLNYQCTSEIELASPVNSSEVSLKHQTRFDSKLNEKNDDGSRPVGNVPNWFPNAISSAKFISHYNLAVAYAVREEWNKALECLMQTNTNGSLPPRALSLLIYVQLHQGTAEDTKVYVKQYEAHKNT